MFRKIATLGAEETLAAAPLASVLLPSQALQLLEGVTVERNVGKNNQTATNQTATVRVRDQEVGPSFIHQVQ